MPDIVTSRTFVDGEKNITAQKLNDIVASSVIQPAFVSAKPPASTVAPTDNLLVLTAAGSYAKAPFQTVIDSVNANLNTNAAIWSARLRSFNALGNPTFEVDQRNVGNTVSTVANGAFFQDRWQLSKGGTMVISAGQNSVPAGINLPGTNFAISRSFLRVTLTTAQASLAAGDSLRIAQVVEGPRWRELQNDVHSLQVLVRSSVANLSFGVALRDPTSAHSLTNILTLGAANTWALLTLPNLPVWPAGTFVNTPDSAGYFLDLTLAAGSTYISPANSTWQNGAFLGAVGQSNFANSPVNSTFDVALIQHEPGALCSTPPMDCSFTDNLYVCKRYFQKTYSLMAAIGTPSTTLGMRSFVTTGAAATAFGVASFETQMAKPPTMTLYNHSTGASGSVQDGIGTNHAGATAAGAGDSGFNYIYFTGATTAAVQVYTHWTADTGW